jgi:hypothetical protein
MIVEQVSVFIENKSGTLLDLVDALGNAKINIQALSIAETADYGIVRMIVSDTEKCEKVLKEQEFTVKIRKVIQVQTPDEPGALAAQLKHFAENDVNVKYMYGYSNGGTAYLVMKVDDPEKAVKFL